MPSDCAAMSDPVARTFELLTASPSAFAGEVLLAALEVEEKALRDRAAAALLTRSGARGHVEVIRRWGKFDEAVRSRIDRRAKHLEPALKYAIEHGDELLRRNAHEVARRCEAYDLLPVLLRALDSDDDRLADDAAQTIRELTDRLFEHLNQRGGIAPRNPPVVRSQFLTALDQSITRFDERRRPEVIVETILALGDPGHFAVKKALWQGAPACRELAARLLLTSRHPGVMRLVLESFSLNYPHVRVFEAVSRRSDPEFICFLLRWFPQRLTKIQQKNFAQIESVAWLDRTGAGLEAIPPALEPALIRLIAALGVPFETKLAVQEWLLRNGSPEGRLAAADALGRVDQSAVQQIVLEGLSCDDPGVQAWATGQLRSFGGPEAFTLLIERLDSPLEQVRRAAREELSGFDLNVMLDLYEQLAPETCRRAGELLWKIDPDLLALVRAELAGPLRRRKIRVAQAVWKMGLHEHVVDALGGMLEEDALVRRVAAEILATIASSEADRYLQRAADDPSPRVREVALRALEESSPSVPPIPQAGETAVAEGSR